MATMQESIIQQIVSIRLAECDWVVLRAKELGQPVPREWYDYRSKLRQVNNQEGFPDNVIWPDKPS